MKDTTTKKAAKNWEITDGKIVRDCPAGRMKKAKKMENTWLVPADAEKTADGRYRNRNGKNGENS